MHKCVASRTVFGTNGKDGALALSLVGEAPDFAQGKRLNNKALGANRVLDRLSILEIAGKPNVQVFIQILFTHLGKSIGLEKL